MGHQSKLLCAGTGGPKVKSTGLHGLKCAMMESNELCLCGLIPQKPHELCWGWVGRGSSCPRKDHGAHSAAL